MNVYSMAKVVIWGFAGSWDSSKVLWGVSLCSAGLVAAESLYYDTDPSGWTGAQAGNNNNIIIMGHGWVGTTLGSCLLLCYFAIHYCV